MGSYCIMNMPERMYLPKKKGISDFIAKSLVHALDKDYDSCSIEIKIENNPVNNK